MDAARTASHKGGREYYDEAHHDVTFLRDAEENKDVEMVGADDVSLAIWSIKILPSAGEKIRKPKSLKPILGRTHPGANWCLQIMVWRLGRFIRFGPVEGV
jgi:hypothetical protein